MAHSLLSTTELRNMTLEDLERDLGLHRSRAAKLRLDIELKKEKDTAKYRRERRAIARMKTICDEKKLAAPPVSKTPKPKTAKVELKKEKKTRTVRAPKKS